MVTSTAKLQRGPMFRGRLFAAIVFGVAIAGPAVGQSEIRIGVLEPLSGPIAAEGRRQLNGMEVVRDIVNERGGIAGMKLVFAVGDAANATAATNEANRLVTQEGVKVIVGTFSSSVCVPASDVAARNNVVYWEVSCVDPRFTKRGYKNVYRTEIDADGLGWYNIEFIRDSLHKKLGMDLKDMKLVFLSEDSAYGQGTTEPARKRAEQLGMKVLATDYYNRTTMTDFTPLILKLKALKPDVIVATQYPNDAILFWKQARQLDLEVKAVVSGGAVGYGSPDFGKSLGKMAEGPFILLEPGGLNPKALTKDMVAFETEVRKRYEAKYKEPYAASAQLGVAGFWMLTEVLKKTGGNLNPEKFRAAVLGLDIPVGAAPNGWGAKFGDDGQNANERVQHYALQWQDGKQITVWPEQFAVAPMRHVPLGNWANRQ